MKLTPLGSLSNLLRPSTSLRWRYAKPVLSFVEGLRTNGSISPGPFDPERSVAPA